LQKNEITLCMHFAASRIWQEACFERECSLRHRQTGDYIRPFGSQGRQSLQDYLVNRHIDAPFRDEIPLLCRGSEVVWVCGVGAGEAVRGQPDEERILVRLEGEMPWARK